MLRTTFPSFSERFFPNSFFSVLFLIVSDSTLPFSSSHNGSKTRNSVPLWNIVSNAVPPQRKCRDFGSRKGRGPT